MNPSRVTDDSSLITNYPRVSTIILNWNGVEDTIECLESLRKITYPNYQVIVVDNGSKSNDIKVLEKKFGDYIHLIQNDRNYGFAKGNNIGIRYALHAFHPDYVLLLNNDIVVAPEFLSEMVKVAEADPAIGVTGAKIYYYDDPARLQFVWGKTDLWRGQSVWTPREVGERIKRIEVDKGQYDSIREVDCVTTGCCFLAKRSVLADIGSLDESYFCYWEDTDYCIRAKKAGYKVIHVPKSKVWHKRTQSANKVSGFTRYYLTRNRFHFVKKHATKRQYRCFLTYFFGFYFWLATGYYLISCHSLNLLSSFYHGVANGLFGSEASAKLYIRD